MHRSSHEMLLENRAGSSGRGTKRVLFANNKSLTRNDAIAVNVVSHTRRSLRIASYR